MIEFLLPDKADYSKPLKPSVVYFVKGTKTFVNGYTKGGAVKKSRETRGTETVVFPPKNGRYPTNVLFGEALD